MAVRSLTAAALVAVLLAPASASAGGFYLADRGTRPLGRGGAYVAGVDDPHALWYNPAGLAYSGDQFLLDATLTFFEVVYTRIDSGMNVLPTVSGHHAYLPIPTIAGSFDFDELPNFTFGVGLFAPNAALMEWPDSVTVGGMEQPAPQRYSLLSLEGSILSTIALGAAWRPIKELSIGFSPHFLFGNFNAQVALSACDGTLCSFPEDPEYDAVAQISLPVFFPIFHLGAIVDLDIVRIGVSFVSAYNLEGSGGMRIRPPPAAAFSGAQVVDRATGISCSDPSTSAQCPADAQLEFPWVVRLGVEVRPIPDLRLEAALVWETWSVQDEARIIPRNVWIEGGLGGGLDYQVGPMNIPRFMHDTVSVRIGAEYTIDDIVTVRAGGYFENGAFDDAYLSALTVDSDKVVMGAGVGINVSPEVSIDATVGYIWLAPRSVRNSMVPQPNPIRPPASTAETVFVGNGDYSMTAPYFGLGFRYRVDGGRIHVPGEDEEEEEPTPPPEEEPEEEPATESVDAAVEVAPETTEIEAAPEPEEEPRTRRRRRRR